MNNIVYIIQQISYRYVLLRDIYFYEYKLDFLFILKVESSDYDAYEQQ